MQTFTLPVGYRLTVTADANTVGTFWRLSDSVGEEPYSPTALTASSSETAGPFNVATRWAMDSSLGALTHTTALFAPDAESVDGIDGAEIIQRDGSIPLTAAWDVGPWQVQAETFKSDIASGNPPLIVASTDRVPNLNADTVDGVEAAAISQLGVAQETTKQHGFNQTALTALGADSVPNGDFTDGADIAVNGAFTGDSDWTKGDGWTLPGTVATSDASQAGDSDLINTGVAVEAGQAYLVTFTISTWNAGNCTPVVGAQEGTDRGSAATFVEVIVASDTTPLTMRADVSFNGSIDNVTIVLIGDAGWTQGTGWLISAGNASSSGDQSADADLEDDANAPSAGQAYEIEYVVSGYSAGNVTAVVGDTEGTDRSADGTFTEIIVASNTDVLKIRADADFIGSVDSVTMKLANVSWDLDDNQSAGITLDGDVVIDNPTNQKAGSHYWLHIIQDGTGGRQPTWGSAYEWQGGVAPTILQAAAAMTVIHFYSDGSVMHPSLLGAPSQPAIKSYSFHTRDAASGENWLGGFYDYDIAEEALTNASLTKTHGGSNVPYAAHAFVVVKENGSTDGSDLVLTVSGTSINDQGLRTTTDSEVIVADCVGAGGANAYFETVKKWLGTITFTLSSSGGSTYDFTFNFGFAKYEDYGNRDFSVVDVEAVGLTNANDSGFDVQLLKHSSAGWTFHASAFVAGSSEVVGMATDHSTESDVDAGEYIAWKRDNLSTAIAGSNAEGLLVRVTTSVNNSISYLDVHVGVIF